MTNQIDDTNINLISLPENSNLQLQMTEEGLSLVGDGRTICGDFTRILPRITHSNLSHELLVKASKLKGIEGPLTAIDATAGMGEDAFLLAAAGFSVKLYENDPIIAALLRDALHRAQDDPELSAIANRMEFFETDSIVALPQLEESADVILLDPMFPARQKSALIKKKFQLLQQLERPCSNEEELLNAAISNHPRRIVIKRPLKGAFLAGRKPDYSLKGKAIRYDCIVLPRNDEIRQ
ncbi:MAG: class I SAM-dependent methyltransferase [Lachnospiraceae bacterium]|nr:class I SAM-dependent methyltransferase [Lachnospiraceae bacterium]